MGLSQECLKVFGGFQKLHEKRMNKNIVLGQLFFSFPGFALGFQKSSFVFWGLTTGTNDLIFLRDLNNKNSSSFVLMLLEIGSLGLFRLNFKRLNPTLGPFLVYERNMAVGHNPRYLLSQNSLF